MSMVMRSRSSASSLWLAAICLFGPVHAQTGSPVGPPHLFMIIENANGSPLVAGSSQFQGESGAFELRGYRIGPPIATINEAGGTTGAQGTSIIVTVDGTNEMLTDRAIEMGLQGQTIPVVVIVAIRLDVHSSSRTATTAHLVRVTLHDVSVDSVGSLTRNGTGTLDTTIQFTAQSITVGTVGVGASTTGSASATTGLTGATPPTMTVPQRGRVQRPANAPVPAGVPCTPKVGQLCPPFAPKPFSLPGYGKPTNLAGPPGG